MAILIIIQIVLNAILLHAFKTRVYSDSEFTKLVKFPIWVYLVSVISAIIPLLGIVSFALCLLITTASYDVVTFPEPGKKYHRTTYFYKSGRILKLLHNICKFLQKPL